MVTKKILFVCSGNICRSPAAETIMQHLLNKHQLDQQYKVDSCGTHDYHHGEKADPRMRRIAEKHGYTITSIARKFINPDDFIHSTYIIVMDDSHLNKLIAWDKPQRYHHKITKMTNYCQHQKITEVPDPYYGNDSNFEQVIDILEDACAGLLHALTHESE